MIEMNTKERILEILHENRRDGMADMVRYLEEGTQFFGAGGDFFTAPASTKHHLVCIDSGPHIFETS